MKNNNFIQYVGCSLFWFGHVQAFQPINFQISENHLKIINFREGFKGNIFHCVIIERILLTFDSQALFT